MKYEFHPEAEQKLYEAALRYESEISGLGRRFGDEVSRAIQLLLEHPELATKRVMAKSDPSPSDALTR